MRATCLLLGKLLNQTELARRRKWGERLLAIEVKATARPAPSDAATLRVFIEEYDDTVHGALLLHDGSDTFRLGERVVAAPWWRVI